MAPKKKKYRQQKIKQLIYLVKPQDKDQKFNEFFEEIILGDYQKQAYYLKSEKRLLFYCSTKRFFILISQTNLKEVTEEVKLFSYGKIEI